VGVEFQLASNDHVVVEDFLTRHPAGVSAITVHAKAARHQQGAAEAAQAAGLGVYLNPATERLVVPGYDMPDAPYFAGAPYDVAKLAADPATRARLIDAVIGWHPGFTTAITPPHFFVGSPGAASLNAVLAADTRSSTDKPVRAVLVLGRSFGVKHAESIAAQYVHAGISHLELRISPFGGEDQSLNVLRSGFAILDAFRSAGISTTLGGSGNIGQVAVALGHAASFSVGVGVLEHVNHVAAISAQQKPPRFDENGKRKQRGGGNPVYLPGIAQTLSPKRAAALLGHSDIRLRLGCRLEQCGTSIEGPTKDPRRHYLHARASEMEASLAQPPQWRAHAEIVRLRRALELRELINNKYLRASEDRLKTRTLRSVVDLVEGQDEVRSTA